MEESLAYDLSIGNARHRRFILLAACLGVMTTVVDSTVVNVALPSIRADLRVPDRLLVWIMNGYFVPYGGALLICGRLGDYFGHARVFMVGIVAFTLASIGCGVAWSPGMLIAMRVVQGWSAAASQAVTFALILQAFRNTAERAYALGLLSVGSAGGGSAGILIGGILTSSLGWRWIFLINIPVGLITCGLTLASGRMAIRGGRAGSLDVAGAVAVTTSLTLCLLAMANATNTGFMAGGTLALIFSAALIFGVFIAIELRAAAPIAPLGLFINRHFSLGSCANTLWQSAQFVWFFITALYLQGTFGYDALHVAFAFLPVNIVVAVFSFGISKWLVVHLGTRRPIVAGLLLEAAGLFLLAGGPPGNHFAVAVFPAMTLIGLGLGIGYNALLLSTLQDVPAADYGIASGVVNTAGVMSGCMSIAILANIIAYRAQLGITAGENAVTAASGGYRLAFGIAACMACIAAAIGGLGLKSVTESR